ncbi:uncharacterized protein TRUGW13939_03777, partial [Talaromyces rugulosus]
CPNCSNALTISRGEAAGGLNRFECRACPYQYAIDISWFEQRTLKQKEVEPVFGGKKSHENVDSMEGGFLLYTLVIEDSEYADTRQNSAMSVGNVQRRSGVFLSASNSQCGRADDYILGVYDVQEDLARLRALGGVS